MKPSIPAVFDRPRLRLCVCRSQPRSRRLRRAGAALLGAALAAGLAACAPPPQGGMGVGPGADGAAAVLTAGGKSIRITPPTGFCVDDDSINPQGDAAFVLIQDCALNGEAEAIETDNAASRVAIPQPALVDGLVMLSIASTPLFQGDETAGFVALETFLRSSAGRASAGMGGDADSISIVETRRLGDTLYVLVEDKGEHVVPALGARFWRAFTQVNDRAMIASLGVFDSSSMRDVTKLGYLARIVTAIKDGNGDPVAEAERKLAATAPAAAPRPRSKPPAPQRQVSAPPPARPADGA